MTRSQSFSAFLKYFSKEKLPVTLSEENVTYFSNRNPPIPQELIRRFIAQSTTEEDDEYTECTHGNPGSFPRGVDKRENLFNDVGHGGRLHDEVQEYARYPRCSATVGGRMDSYTGCRWPTTEGVDYGTQTRKDVSPTKGSGLHPSKVYRRCAKQPNYALPHGEQKGC